ncbi:MAG: hypothetical protein N2109_08745 [Fimbriimonadales bacterium]|nr:hypothetical protein [Fimbriimonadales bacterium]
MSRIQVPGLELDADGLRVRHPAADRLRFEHRSLIWVVQDTSATGQAVTLTGASGAPAKARANLWGEGIELFFRAGIRLRLASMQAPYLTWSEGSAGPGVPTPPSGWCLLSFRDSQPPLLFAFQGRPASLRLEGRSGDWVLRSEGSFQGWVRVVAPLGVQPHPANSARALGELAQTVRPFAEAWREPTPAVLETRLEESPTAVELRYRFDRPGAVVPPAAVLAPLGGYGVKLFGELVRRPALNEEGPVHALKGIELALRFPCRRIPTGRALAVGRPAWEPPATVSAIDAPSVAELALGLLTSWCDRAAQKAAEEALESFLGEASFEPEPHTKAPMPFGADGAQAELVAAHALLMQASRGNERASSEGNSLLTSLAWRRDAATWRFWGATPLQARRVGALAAVAGALCPEPERRLDGALFEAGLAAERGLQAWLRRRDPSKPPEPLEEPLEGLRRALFDPQSQPATPEGLFVRMLQSPLRAYGPHRVWLEPEPEGTLRLSWTVGDTRPATLVLASATPLELRALGNLASFEAQPALGFVVLRFTPSDAGDCTVRLRLPDYASPPPPAAAPPAFSAPRR